MLGLANLASVRVETMDRFVESETIRTPFLLRDNCLLVFELHRTIRSSVHLFAKNAWQHRLSWSGSRRSSFWRWAAHSFLCFGF